MAQICHWAAGGDHTAPSLKGPRVTAAVHVKIRPYGEGANRLADNRLGAASLQLAIAAWTHASCHKVTLQHAHNELQLQSEPSVGRKTGWPTPRQAALAPLDAACSWGAVRSIVSDCIIASQCFLAPNHPQNCSLYRAGHGALIAGEPAYGGSSWRQEKLIKSKLMILFHITCTLEQNYEKAAFVIETNPPGCEVPSHKSIKNSSKQLV